MKKLIKEWGWDVIILGGLLFGYMGYVFIMAIINTICDCIQENKMTDSSLFDGVNYKPIYKKNKKQKKKKQKQSVLWTVYHTILAVELLIIIIIEGIELYYGVI